MKSWMKNVDMDQMKEQMTDIKDQIQELKFRKPWTRGEDTSPFMFMALGAALTWAGLAIYKNRDEVANFCSNCGAKLKDTWEQSGIKQKAEKAMGKAKDTARESMASATNGQEPLY